uniref:EF-hand domain-containing protein n=1 Tax=Spongospora subterranea TaxID=70186 RepID=A0A0H5QRT9_9EUKA|eukprot:CRZ04724.1 hypothetical protein [Spongospora subterranea]
MVLGQPVMCCLADLSGHKCVSDSLKKAKPLPPQTDINRESPAPVSVADFIGAHLNSKGCDLAHLLLDVFYISVRGESVVPIHENDPIITGLGPIAISNVDPMPSTISIVDKHCSGPNFHRLISSVALPNIPHIPSPQLLVMKSIFDHARNGPANDMLTRSDLNGALRPFLKDQITPLNDQVLSRIALGFDRDHSGNITFTSFALRISDLYFGTLRDRQHIVFDMIDGDGDGAISSSELFLLHEDPAIGPIFRPDIEPLMDHTVSRYCSLPSPSGSNALDALSPSPNPIDDGPHYQTQVHISNGGFHL